MPGHHFNLIFNGQISPDSYLPEVKNQICTLLKVDLAKAETMFDGRTVVLKKDISRDEADKYKRIFDKTGAMSIIVPAIEAESQSTVPPQSTAPESRVSSPESGTQQKEASACLSRAAIPENEGVDSGNSSSGCAAEEAFICPKCGTSQVKASTCVRCGVIFERITAHAERRPSDQQPPDKQLINEVVPDGNQAVITQKTILPGTRAYLVLLSLLIIIGGCALAYSSVKLVKTTIFLNTSQIATGTVIGFASSRSTGSSSRSTTYAPEVDFRAPDGRLIRFTSQLSSNFVPYKTSDEVSVRYDPSNPYHAEINAFMPLWGIVIILLFIGIFFTWCGWHMLGIHRKAKTLNFEQYAQGKILIDDLMLCPKCGVQQPPAAVCKFCQADIAAEQNSKLNRWVTALRAASAQGTAANMPRKVVRTKYALQFVAFLISVSIFAWQWKSMSSNTSHKVLPFPWRDSFHKIALTVPPDWQLVYPKDVANYPMLLTQRNDKYSLIATSKTTENTVLAYGTSGMGLDHFKSVGWEGIVAEIGQVNRVKSADVIQLNGLTLYRVGYEIAEGYREDAYIEAGNDLMEVCFAVPNGTGVDERASSVRNLLASNLNGI